MKIIRSIILDFGGVISQPQNTNHVDNMLKIINHKPPDFLDIYRKFRADYDSGEYSGEEYWDNIIQHYGYQLNDGEIKDLIYEDTKSWTKINDKMLYFIKDVRKRIYNLSIISNMPLNLLYYLKENFDWLSYFDELTWSCEIGVNKPDPRIFKHCLDMIDISPQDCLFVDDSIDNVSGAASVGLNAFHFTSYPKLIEELEQKYQLSKL